MSGNMNIEMVLRLVDQATAPLRGVTKEFRDLEKAAEGLGRGAGARMGAHEYFEGLKRAGDEAKRTRQSVDDLRDSISRLGTASLAFQNMSQVGAAIARPMDTAKDRAREFEKEMRSITVAGDILGQDEAIGRGIMEAARASGLKWEDIARGERQLVELGGGEYVGKIANVREKLAKLAKAAEADPAELYNMMYHYMELNHLTEQQAFEALSINYAQGKKGAYELKNMAQGLPKLEGLAMDYYGKNAGWQVAVDIPAALQMLRKVTGNPGEADTRLRHLLTKLTDPNEAKKIKKELGVDVYATREKAMKSGADPLFATLDAIADQLGKQGPKAGKLNNQTHEVEGVDVKKLGGIAREYYFRSGIEAWTQMRQQLPEFLVSSGDANKTVDESFTAQMATAAASADRLSNALDAAAIKIGTTQLGADKKKSEFEENLTRKGADFIGEHPFVADMAGYASWAGGHALEALGKVGEVGVAGLAGVQTLRNLRARSAAGATESAFANPPNLKGAPIDLSAPNVGAAANYEQAVRAIAENGGKAEGLTGEAAEIFGNAHPTAQARMLKAAKAALKSAPGGASLLGRIATGLGKGLIYGAVEMAGEWAIDQKFDRAGVARGEKNIHAGADKFYKDMHLPRPQWPSFISEAKGEPINNGAPVGPSPQSAASARGEMENSARAWWRSQGVSMPWWNQPEGLQQQAQPKVDATQIEAVQQKAQAAGEAIKTNLDVTANPQADTTQIEAAGTKATEAGEAIGKLNIAVKPEVDASSIDAAARKVDELLRKLKQVGAEAKAAGTSAHWARARLGASPSSGSLHDGPEAH